MALNHKEPDRVPVDLGSTNVTSINVDSYKKLCSYLGVTLSEEIKIVERAQQIVTPEETVLQSLCIDTRSVWLKRPKNWEISLREDNSYIDEWGITRRKSYDGLYFDPVVFPLKESEIEDLRTYSWPDPGDSERFKGLKEKARKIHRENQYPLIVDPTGSIPFQNAQSLRGFDVFLMDLLLNQNFAEALMDKILEFQINLFNNLFNKIGTYIDVIKIADDLGAQNAPLISPEIYRKLIKPRHRVLIDYIKENTDAKVLLHTDGDVYPLIKDFIEIGVDILNPIQISANEMEPKRLKREFGNELCFWGGVDSQEVLPHGSAQDVKKEVKKMIDILSPNGGYILCAVHNIQPDVPPQNIAAMYEAVQEYGE